MNDTLNEMDVLREEYKLDKYNLEIAPRLAQIYADKGWLNESIEIYKSLVDKYPNDFNVMLAYGNACFSKNDLKESLLIFRKLTVIRSDRVEGWNNLGITQLSLKDYRSAKESFKKVLEIEPDNCGALLNMGNYYDHFKKYEKAIDIFKRVTSMRPDFTDAWFNLGNAFMKMQRYEEAIAVYNKSLKFKPQFYSAFKNIGFAYEQIKDYKKAEEYYTRALEINKADAVLYINFGSVYTNLKLFGKAKDFFLRAVKLSPKKVDGWLGLRELSLKKGDISSYVKATLAILNHLSGTQIAQTVKMLRKLNQDKSINDIIQSADRLEKQGDEIDAERMLLYYKNKKERVNAQLLYKKLSNMDKPSDHVLHCLAFFCIYLSQFEKAIGYLQQIQNKDISDNLLLWSALIENKELSVAEKNIVNYLNKHQDCFEGWYLLAKIMAKEGKYAKSEEYLMRAFETGYADLGQLETDKDLLMIYNKIRQ
ncbi:MAG: tetratricopeptide repeat protein [Chitinispirillia bacterium]